MTAKNINRLASLQLARKSQLMAAILNMRNKDGFRAAGSFHDVGEDLKINCAPTKQCICSY